MDNATLEARIAEFKAYFGNDAEVADILRKTSNRISLLLLNASDEINKKQDAELVWTLQFLADTFDGKELRG
jgi:hypothetical protein